LDAHLKGQEAHFELEYRIRHRDGTYRWMLSRGLAVRDERGEAYRMAGSLTDMPRRKEAEERLLHDALHDGLTGLANRTLFADRLHQALARSRRRNDYSFAVLYVDVDQFKVVNDSLGHQAGDEVLVALARRLEACLRPGDTVARLGGDEFAVLVEDMEDASQALSFAARSSVASCGSTISRSSRWRRGGSRAWKPSSAGSTPSGGCSSRRSSSRSPRRSARSYRWAAG